MEKSTEISTITKYQEKVLNLFVLNLSVILTDSVFKTGKSYYPQVFSEECKYVVKERKTSKYIIDEIKIFSDSDRENSDEENSNKENSDKKTSGEKHSDKKSSDEQN